MLLHTNEDPSSRQDLPDCGNISARIHLRARTRKLHQQHVAHEAQNVEDLSAPKPGVPGDSRNSTSQLVSPPDQFNANPELFLIDHDGILPSNSKAALAPKSCDKLETSLLHSCTQTTCSRAGISLQNLPLEVRQHIFSYVITVPSTQSVHVYEARNRLGYFGNWGWRLSLCEERFYDMPNGECKCQQGQNPQFQSEYFDNALLLVSKSVRREALDVFFSTNSFTFDSFHEVGHFSLSFESSAAKISSLRVFIKFSSFNLAVYPLTSSLSIESIRRRLSNLRDLNLQLYQHWHADINETHEDDIIGPLYAFAFPRLTKFKCNVHIKSLPYPSRSTQGRSGSSISALAQARRMEHRLVDVFRGSYKRPDHVEVQQKAPKRRDQDCPPTNRKGILVLRD